MNKKQPYVVISEITKDFGGNRAVNNINLTTNKGEIFALLGASGCGKTTLLRMIAGFVEPDKGSIKIDGVEVVGVPPHKRPVNMMFQSYALFPHLNVFNNILFGLKQDSLSVNEMHERARQALKTVKMEKFENRPVDRLSGGQQQRVALARILAKHPKLVLLDEPMGALDKKLREEMRLELVNILEQVGATCIIVTHDQEEAMALADRIAVMNEGSIMQVGEPEEIYETPHNKYTAEFFGNVNLLPGVIKEDEPDFVKIHCEKMNNPILIGHGITCYLDQEVSVAIRPEKVFLSRTKPHEDTNNWDSGKVEDINYLGSKSIYYIRNSKGFLIKSEMSNISRQIDDRFTWGDEVYFSWSDDSPVPLFS